MIYWVLVIIILTPTGEQVYTHSRHKTPIGCEVAARLEPIRISEKTGVGLKNLRGKCIRIVNV